MTGNTISSDLDVLESEHLIGRLKLLELLERQAPYRDLRDRVDRRISQALTTIPEHFRQSALAIFGTTLFITRQILDDAWRFLWSSFCRSFGGLPKPQELLILELDRDLLRDEFYRANALEGRLQDNLPFRSSYDLVDAMMQLESGHIGPELKDVLPEILQRPHWLLLIDTSISGASASVELDRLHRIRKLIYPHSSGSIVALIQLATEQAHNELTRTGQRFISAINIPLRYALNSEEYSAVNNPELVIRMKELCSWFAETHILTTDCRLAKMSKRESSPTLATFGFGQMGWSIVTHKNTPNNSLPLLWFKPPSEAYRPPFERIDSRISTSWFGRKQWLERLEREEPLRIKVLESLHGLREERRR